MASTTIRVIERRRKYHWPEAQLNLWLIIMIASSATILGVFSYLLAVQNQLKIGIPWLFPYMVSVSAMAIVFLIAILALISQRQLLPGIVVLGSFILFVLWLTGLIETSIQLYGPSGGVNTYCSIYRPVGGSTQETMAWLANNGICTDWKAAFAFEIVGTVFLLWMMVMAYQVNRDDYD